MNIQQRRLFFQARKSGGSSLTKPNWGRIIRFAYCEVILATLTALLFFLFGCASLTPDRVAVLAAIAGQAAQVGAADWLVKHPEHRALFAAALAELTALARAGITTNSTNEMAVASALERLSQLPTATLSGPEGAVYMRMADLVVWDGRKMVVLQGAATVPVLKAIRVGLWQAMAPMPPAPVPVPLTETDGIKKERVR